MAFLTQKVPPNIREKKLGSYIKKEGCYDFSEKYCKIIHFCPFADRKPEKRILFWNFKPT